MTERAVGKAPARAVLRALACAILAIQQLAFCATALTAQPAPQVLPPLSPFARQKAESLLRDKLACLGCHKIGRQGGMLAPSLDDVRTRRDPAYIATIIRDPQRVRPGAAMPKARLNASDRTLIIRYFGGDPAATPPPLAPGPSAPPPPALTTTSASTETAALYQRWCAGCHGAKGNGDGPNATSLPIPPAKHTDARSESLRSDDALYDTIDGGGAIMNRSARMPGFGASLSAAEIRALVRYIRTLCACEGPTWSRGVP